MIMKTKSKFWACQTAMILLLLTIADGCNDVEPEPAPIVIPTIISVVSDISGTSVTITGDLTPCKGGWSGYNLWFCYSNMISLPTEYNNYIVDTSNHGSCGFSMVLPHLTPGTTYFVRAIADGSYGNVLEFTTSGSVVGEIQYNSGLVYGSVADITGNTYKTIQIGSQTWMAENLKTSKLNDGTDIPLIVNTGEWRGLSTPAYCWYLNDEPTYKNPYGAIYNWHTVNSAKLCPTGWHVPGTEEWTTLSNYLGGDSVAFGKLRETGTTHWVTADAEVTNNSGFTALPGGMRDVIPYVDVFVENDIFHELGYEGEFWSTDIGTSDMFGTVYGETFGISHENSCGISEHYKCAGFSVRCVKD